MLRKWIIALLPFALILFLTSEKMSDDGRAGYTGSPGENDCTSCHGSFPVNTGGGSITLQNTGMPLNEYVAGQTYNLSVTVARSTNNLFGFAFEALNSLNDNAGTLNITDAAATQIKTRVVNTITRRNVVHQLNAGAMSGSKTFNFSWTAPAAGTGTVGFYFAGVAADGNGNDNNDYVYKSTLTINEQVCVVPDLPQSIMGNATVCQGSLQNYSVSPVSGATSYSWTIPSGWAGTSTSNSITLTAGISSGTLSVTANNTCGSSQASTLSLLSDNITTTFSNVNVLCYGGTNGSTSANVSGGIPPYTYGWTAFPSQNTSTLNNLPAGNYLLNITDGIGCTLDTSLTITQPSTALSADAGLAQTICEGSDILIGGNPVANGGTIPYIYSWTPATDLNSASISNPLANPTITTSYTLLLTDNNGCTTSTTTTVNVLSAPPLTISQSNDTLFASGSGPFKWYKNGVVLTGDSNQFIIPISNNTYYVSTEYPNGCLIQSASLYYSTISVNEIDNELNVEIFPNPFSDQLLVSLPSELINPTFKVYSISGQILFDEILSEKINQLKLDNLSKGIYFIHISESGSEKFFKGKLVKQ